MTVWDMGFKIEKDGCSNCLNHGFIGINDYADKYSSCISTPEVWHLSWGVWSSCSVQKKPYTACFTFFIKTVGFTLSFIDGSNLPIKFIGVNKVYIK